MIFLLEKKIFDYNNKAIPLHSQFLTSASPYELYPAHNINISVTKGLEPASVKTALFLYVFGVKKEEAEILQVETKDTKSME